MEAVLKRNKKPHIKVGVKCTLTKRKVEKLKRNVRVALYGVGVIGSMIAKFLLEKQGVEIVGAIDVAQDKVGKDLGDVIGLSKRLGIVISDDVDAVLLKTKPDVAVHTTTSFMEKVYPQVAQIVKHGVNVVSTCEELSYPYLSSPKLVRELDALAKQHDVTVLGTGINPGFLMDTLVIALTAPCQKIDQIRVVRVMNAATRRVPFQKKIGAGLSIAEFKQKMQTKAISGHVGLEQSIAMIANALAWELDEIKVDSVEPIVAKKPVKSEAIRVEAGQVAGLRQCAYGVRKGRKVISLEFQAYIGAEEEYDAITIEGVPPINEKISPCVHGDFGTIAMVCNSIPKVINAEAGLVTMKDLPVPSAAVEDIRKYIKE
jgi:4-hydroxy-tetrahydrodipicolinate reductase